MISIKDKILKASSEGSKFCLMMVDFNKFDTDKYFAREDDYISNEIICFSSVENEQVDNMNVKVNREELLGACNLFIEKFMQGKKVSFICMRKHRHNKDRMSSYKKCKRNRITLMDFSKTAYDMGDWAQMQHFQFKLSKGRYQLCGFVHGFFALGELTKNMAMNLPRSKVKIKCGDYFE